MAKHKHCELIKAWADGAEIQFRWCETAKWEDADPPTWVEFHEYRVKPKKIRYRLYLEAVTGRLCVATFGEGCPTLMSKWVGEEQEVEV